MEPFEFPKMENRRTSPGAASLDEDQVKLRIEGKGYSNVSGLQKDNHGIWRGKAIMNDGSPVTVTHRSNPMIVDQVARLRLPWHATTSKPAKPVSIANTLMAGTALIWLALRHDLALLRRLYEPRLGQLIRKSLHLIYQIDCTTHRQRQTRDYMTLSFRWRCRRGFAHANNFKVNLERWTIADNKSDLVGERFPNFMMRNDRHFLGQIIVSHDCYLLVREVYGSI
jgi:hypothetical protein